MPKPTQRAVADKIYNNLKDEINKTVSDYYSKYKININQSIMKFKVIEIHKWLGRNKSPIQENLNDLYRYPFRPPEVKKIIIHSLSVGAISSDHIHYVKE